MKHYLLPSDVDFPDLDEQSRSELDAGFARANRLLVGLPKAPPKVISFSPEFLRTLPDKNRAMYKYIWLRHVQEYETYMRQHPELDCD